MKHFCQPDVFICRAEELSHLLPEDLQVNHSFKTEQDKLSTRGRAGMRVQVWAWALGFKPLMWCGGGAGSISCSQLCARLRGTVGLKTFVCSLLEPGDRGWHCHPPKLPVPVAGIVAAVCFGEHWAWDWCTHTCAISPSNPKSKLSCVLGTQIISFVVLIGTWSFSLALLKHWISFQSGVLL